MESNPIINSIMFGLGMLICAIILYRKNNRANKSQDAQIAEIKGKNADNEAAAKTALPSLLKERYEC